MNWIASSKNRALHGKLAQRKRKQYKGAQGAPPPREVHGTMVREPRTTTMEAGPAAMLARPTGSYRFGAMGARQEKHQARIPKDDVPDKKPSPMRPTSSSPARMMLTPDQAIRCFNEGEEVDEKGKAMTPERKRVAPSTNSPKNQTSQRSTTSFVHGASSETGRGHLSGAKPAPSRLSFFDHVFPERRALVGDQPLVYPCDEDDSLASSASSASLQLVSPRSQPMLMGHSVSTTPMSGSPYSFQGRRPRDTTSRATTDDNPEEKALYTSIASSNASSTSNTSRQTSSSMKSMSGRVFTSMCASGATKAAIWPSVPRSTAKRQAVKDEHRRLLALAITAATQPKHSTGYCGSCCEAPIFPDAPRLQIFRDEAPDYTVRNGFGQSEPNGRDWLNEASPRFSNHTTIRPSPTQDTEMQWQPSPTRLLSPSSSDISTPPMIGRDYVRPSWADASTYPTQASIEPRAMATYNDAPPSMASSSADRHGFSLQWSQRSTEASGLSRMLDGTSQNDPSPGWHHRGVHRLILRAESPSPDDHLGSGWKGPYVVPLQPSAKHPEKWHTSLFRQCTTSNGATDSAKPRHAVINDASFAKPHWIRANKPAVGEGQGGHLCVITRKVGPHDEMSTVGKHPAPAPESDLVGRWQWARHLGKPRSETFVETFAPATTIASSRHAHAVSGESDTLLFEPNFQGQTHAPPHKSSCSRPSSSSFDAQRPSTPETCTPASIVLHNEPEMTVGTIQFTQVAATIADEAQSTASSCSTPLTSHGCNRVANLDKGQPSPQGDAPIEEAPSQRRPELMRLEGFLSSCTDESDSSQPEDTDVYAPTQRLVYASSPEISDLDQRQVPTKSQTQGCVSSPEAKLSVVAEGSCRPWAMQERTRRILASFSRENVAVAQVDPTFGDDAASLAIVLWTLVQCYAQC